MERLGRPMHPGLRDRIGEVITNGLMEVVEDVDGKIIAYLWYSWEADALYVDQLAVEPSLQGQGLGAHLLERADQLARQAGHSFVRLHTGEVMHELIAYYARHGYVEVRRGPHPDGKDTNIRVFMEKRI